jgi:hypothetical protein
MKRHLCLLFGLTPLAACMNSKTCEPVTFIKEVDKPVPADCVPKELRPAPDYVDSAQTLLAAADAAERYQLLAAGRELRIGRLAELEPIIAACRGSVATIVPVQKP